MRHGIAVAALLASLPLAHAEPARTATTGRRGGRLAVALRQEPRTFNPVVALDSPSRDVIGRTTASLVVIDRQTQRTVPGLAESWTVAPDGRSITVRLRRGIAFSDGDPFDADDVIFSFEAYLDERNGSPQRELLVVGGRPVTVKKRDASTVVVEMAAPYAAAERLFDGVAMLPRHRLAAAQAEGRLAQAWGLGTAPE